MADKQVIFIDSVHPVLEQKLEQNEKIIQIYSESLPQLNDIMNGRIVTMSNVN
jgi:hypothetical protein